jgi:hypothetical protein
VRSSILVGSHATRYTISAGEPMRIGGPHPGA